MGKKLVIVGFLLCVALAVYAWMTRENVSLRENLKSKTTREARIVMEDFAVYRYEGPAVRSKLMAKLGNFYEPNVIELDGEVRAERGVVGGVESLSAETATAYFDAPNLSKMMSQTTRLERAELTGFVEVGVKDHLLSTDYAEFLPLQNVVRSSRPVRVEGPGRVFTGDEGFVYSLKDEVLDMPGTVKGVMKIDEGR